MATMSTVAVFLFGMLAGICVFAVVMALVEITRDERRERRRGGDVTDLAGRYAELP